MDRNLVEAKLESLRRCVERIAAKTPSSADQLAQSPDLQDIIALNLQRAVQLSVDLASYLITETDAENLQDRVRPMPLRPDDADTDHPQPLKSIEGT